MFESYETENVHTGPAFLRLPVKSACYCRLLNISCWACSFSFLMPNLQPASLHTLRFCHPLHRSNEASLILNQIIQKRIPPRRPLAIKKRLHHRFIPHRHPLRPLSLRQRTSHLSGQYADQLRQ